MKLSELIAHVGDENITVQRVDGFIRLSTNKKHGDTEITFSTKEITVHELARPNTSKMFGLIVWMPRNKLPIPATPQDGGGRGVT